jgi:hypothetical protein
MLEPLEGVVTQAWRPERRWRIWAAGLAALLVVGGAVATIPTLGWLRSYAPLQNDGGGPATRPFPRMLQNDSATGRMIVVEPGSYQYLYSFVNYGRWPVTMDHFDVDPATGLSVESFDVFPLRGSSHGVTVVGPGRIKFAHYGFADLRFRFRASCRSIPAGGYRVPLQELRVRYRYLRFFARSQRLWLYDRITVRCAG